LSYTKIQCAVIFVLLLIIIFWISFSSLKFYYDREYFIALSISLSVFFFPYVFYKSFRPDPRIVSLLESFLFMQMAILLIIAFSYLMATLNYPFVDSTLASIDSIFKINSSTIVLWFRAHELLTYCFTYFYYAFSYQVPFTILYFSARGDALLLQRYIMQFMIAALLTIILSCFLPALGPYVWYNYTPNNILAAALQQLIELRNGIVDFSKPNGIVTFPSFHALMGLIYIYTFYHERKIIFIPIFILNILMIFSCIPIGEHYFADILGAIPVFLVTIWLESLIYKHIVHPQ
jgi:hypothetical protein